MPDMVFVGFDDLHAKLMQKREQWRPKRKIWVGYEAEYAIYVHEDLEAFHPVGQAKYLEEPARTLQAQIVAVINNALATGMDLDAALYMGGLYLQAESQKLCPVDTGFLRNSAFTLVEIL